MGNETMDLQELASYLSRDAREVMKLASRGHLPGQKIGEKWRFSRAEINHWIETQMHAYTEQQLTALETAGNRRVDPELLISNMLSEATIAVPLTAKTRSSVLRELVKLAEQSWNVYDPEAILDAVREREEMASTALECGVAIPHPHRAKPSTLGDSVIAYGRTTTGIPFGAARGGLTDLFFLVCCRDDRTHLQVLARLSRLLLRPEFLDALRDSDSIAESYEIITSAERDLIAV